MPRITLDLDNETHRMLESERGDLSQQKYIIRLLKEFQLKIKLEKKEAK